MPDFGTKQISKQTIALIQRGEHRGFLNALKRTRKFDCEYPGPFCYHDAINTSVHQDSRSQANLAVGLLCLSRINRNITSNCFVGRHRAMLARTVLRALQTERCFRGAAVVSSACRAAGVSLARCSTSTSHGSHAHGRSSELPAAATSTVLTRDGADEISAKLVGDLTLGVRPQESEVRDPKLIFDLAWSTLHKKLDPAKIAFPR